MRSRTWDNQACTNCKTATAMRRAFMSIKQPTMMRTILSDLTLAMVLLTLLMSSNGWSTHREIVFQRSNNRATSNAAFSTTSFSQYRAPTRLFLAGPLPDGYQEMGEFLIRKAGEQCGATEDQLEIQWKGDRIIVTVHGESFVSIENDDEDLDGEDDESLPDDVRPARGVDVTELARAINKNLDDGDIGLAIAECHSIEVTTPGSSDELIGQVMFDAYKGFDIICRHIDPKTKKEKQIDGRLVERNDDFLILNLKGRMKKLKNANVVSVKLPKAKREKGR